MLAICTVVPGLIAVKDAILPTPDAARPILVLVLVQLYTVPPTVPTKLTAAVDVLWHSVWSAGWATVGVGFTVMVKLIVGPVQVVDPLV